MNYIWFNPVVCSMYSEDDLEFICRKYNLKEVKASDENLKLVHKKYEQEVIRYNDKTIIDGRCPEAFNLVKGKFDNNSLHFPKIEPILIHCARELAGKYITDDKDNLIITTPCESLALLGNKTNLKNVTFISWKNFLKEFSLDIKSKNLNSSPIPPGFFKFKNKKISNLRSKEEIEKFFSNNENKISIVEMLYCENGCHNGDGILDI